MTSSIAQGFNKQTNKQNKTKQNKTKSKMDKPLERNLGDVSWTMIHFILLAIKTALSQFLTRSDKDLIDRKTRELYLSERNQGDHNLYLTILLPCFVCKFKPISIPSILNKQTPFLGLVCVALIVLCCTRIDNPLCKYCSKDYQSMY